MSEVGEPDPREISCAYCAAEQGEPCVEIRPDGSRRRQRLDHAIRWIDSGRGLGAWAESERCNRCHGPNVSWRTPSPLWNLVMRGGSINGNQLYGDLVCIGCFFHLAADAGVSATWSVTAFPEPDGMETTTPTGRVWNPTRWMWEDPS